MSNQKQLRQLIDLIKHKTGLTQEGIALQAGYKRTYLSQALGMKDVPEKLISKLKLTFEDVLKTEQNGIRGTLELNEEPATFASKSIRKPKIDTDPEADGITFLPISAQAGYSKRKSDPIFKSSLQKLFIPGFPYRGERFRIWEVEGNSMEPTFKEHFYVLSEIVEQQFWHQAKDYYAYVIVTIDSVLIKRVYKKSKTEWVLISDNEDLYPQFPFPVSEIKELWFIKRKMDWEMAPPKKFDIKA